MEKKENLCEDLTNSHRIISPKLLLSDNKEDIKQLLLIISNKYKITIDDAALALSKTLENLS